MSTKKARKYLSYAIVLGGALTAGALIIYQNPELFVPCSYIHTEGINRSELTKKQLYCRDKAIANEQLWESRREKEVRTEAKQWPEYQSENLGIALQYPEAITTFSRERNEGRLVFFEAGNILFVRSASSTLYAHRQELAHLSNPAIELKAKELGKTSTDSTDYHNIWDIHIYDAKNDSDLQSIIDSWYGANHCLIAEIKPTAYRDVFDVLLKDKYPSQDSNNDPGSCWINWVSPIKYSTTYGRVAVWNIGQEAQFPYKNCWSLRCSADLPMAASFRFIERR